MERLPEQVPCTWKIVREDPNSTSGRDLRVSSIERPCGSCTGVIGAIKPVGCKYFPAAPGTRSGISLGFRREPVEGLQDPLMCVKTQAIEGQKPF